MAKKDIRELPNFEKSIERLEEIIKETDSSSTELEQVISLVEEGAKLIRHCKGILKNAELRIESLETSEKDDMINESDAHDRTEGTQPFSLN